MESNVYPWVVFLHAEKQCTRTNSPIFVKCTGVLIDYNYVVVAAHCVHWNALQTKICLGEDPGRNGSGTPDGSGLLN
ncbi:hypothetical protein niasHT_034965 [Heterodera trifolii]|uniref:Peptidase S1 domain-containing protein n=1 Tax=Heterodera trifolii TaxID=157864 RepID=A0ABD2I8T3_9BILA